MINNSDKVFNKLSSLLKSKWTSLKKINGWSHYEVLNIDKLIPDPYFTGGGLNATISGGLLDVHVDGNYHDATGLNR